MNTRASEETGFAADRKAGEASRASATDAGRELPEKVRAFLTEIGRALQREAIYPANHPALEGSAAKLREFADAALDGREEISINVARRQLSVDGALTDADNPILSSLADQLHRHGISALTVRREVETQELSELLAALNSDPAGESAPLRARTWRRVHITFIPYEQMRLDTKGMAHLLSGEQSNVWLAFAEAALSEDVIEVETSMDTDRLAASIAEKCADEAYCRHVAERLLAVERAVERDAERSTVLASLASDVVEGMSTGSLGQLLSHAGGSAGRRSLVAAGSSSLRVGAVLKLLHEAGRFEERETPDAMWLVFSKLARRSEPAGTRGEAAASLVRDQVLELVEAWDQDEYMPVDYSAEMAAVASTNGPQIPRSDRGSRTAIEPLRVLQMAVEAERPGNSIRRAADLLIREGSLGAVLDVVEGAAANNEAARQLRAHVGDAELLKEMLSEETPDFALIDRILEVVGLEAASVMLDAIAEGESRANRGRLFRRLVRLGPAIGAEVVARLGDDRWYVRRNLLALLDDIGSPEGFSAVPLLTDEHEAVRRAAIKLVLKEPDSRERGIEVALGSDDPRAVILGLVAAREVCPPELADRVARLAVDENQAEELRLHATRALNGVRHESALSALLRIARRKRRWLFLRSSDPPTPLQVEGLAALRTTWADTARARRALSRWRGEPEAGAR